jgi:hypothetical protein
MVGNRNTQEEERGEKKTSAGACDFNIWGPKSIKLFDLEELQNDMKSISGTIAALP